LVVDDYRCHVANWRNAYGLARWGRWPRCFLAQSSVFIAFIAPIAFIVLHVVSREAGLIVSLSVSPEPHDDR